MLLVEHLNLALKKHRLEPLYGLHDKSSNDTELKSLEEIARQFSAPAVPLRPSLTLHWLAVNGTQPAIPENPVVLSDKTHQELKSLPKEFQNLYVRIVGALLQATDRQTQRAVLDILRLDQCLQPLVPLLARFFYTQIKAHSRTQPVSHLSLLLEAMLALQSNPQVSLDAHLAQLLPGIFTLIAAPQLGNDHASHAQAHGQPSSLAHIDHWALRRKAAQCVAQMLQRYHVTFPDLFARVCRTYLDALHPASQSLATVFGGIAGLIALGEEPLRMLLVPQLPHLKQLLTDSLSTAAFNGDSAASLAASNSSATAVSAVANGSAPQSEMMDVDDSTQTIAVKPGNKRPHGHLASPTNQNSNNNFSSSSTVSQNVRVQRQEEALQCRAILAEALGRLQRTSLPLSVAAQGLHKAPPELCDLEELLGVFLAAQSPYTIPHAFLSL